MGYLLVVLDLGKLSPSALSAAMRGGTGEWGRHGSAMEHVRYAEPCVPAARRQKCRCGCERRKTHVGMANGVALYSGCELSVRRWVKTAT